VKPGDFASSLLSSNEACPKAQSYTDKLLLRIFNYPALMAQLNKVNVQEESVELEFNLLPERIIPEVIKLIAIGKVQVLEYDNEQNRHHFIGFKIDLSDVLDDID